MNLDVISAEVLVWCLVVASWLSVLLPGAVFGAVVAWLCMRQRLRDQRKAVAALSLRVADLDASRATAELVAAQERYNAEAATALAQKAGCHAQAMAAELLDLQASIQRVHDQAVIAQLDRGTEWEVEPQ